MKPRECSPEQQANCPLRQHFKDWHHLYFYKRLYRDELGSEWRNHPTTQRLVCRMVHQAIHDTDYVPQRPSDASMERDLNRGFVAGAEQEYRDQLEYAMDYLMQKQAAGDNDAA